jgi:hypothetical protein
MSSNPFKFQTRVQPQPPYKRSYENNIHRSARDQSNFEQESKQTQNRFRGKDVKQSFSLNDEEFPPMIPPQNKNPTLNENASLDYKSATSIKDPQPEAKAATQDYVPPGHVLIYMDENRKIVRKYGDNTQPVYYMQDPEKEVDPNQVFQQLVNSWELRKQQYDDLYGDGEYDRMYGMPREDYNYDYENEEEDYYDVNDYYDY